MTEEMSFQVSLEICQGFSIPDRGGKFLPSARNGERKRQYNILCDMSLERHIIFEDIHGTLHDTF